VAAPSSGAGFNNPVPSGKGPTTFNKSAVKFGPLSGPSTSGQNQQLRKPASGPLASKHEIPKKKPVPTPQQAKMPPPLPATPKPDHKTGKSQAAFSELHETTKKIHDTKVKRKEKMVFQLTPAEHTEYGLNKANAYIISERVDKKLVENKELDPEEAELLRKVVLTDNLRGLRELPKGFTFETFLGCLLAMEGAEKWAYRANTAWCCWRLLEIRTEMSATEYTPEHMKEIATLTQNLCLLERTGASLMPVVEELSRNVSTFKEEIVGALAVTTGTLDESVSQLRGVVQDTSSVLNVRTTNLEGHVATLMKVPVEDLGKEKIGAKQERVQTAPATRPIYQSISQQHAQYGSHGAMIKPVFRTNPKI